MEEPPTATPEELEEIEDLLRFLAASIPPPIKHDRIAQMLGLVPPPAEQAPAPNSDL